MFMLNAQLHKNVAKKGKYKVLTKYFFKQKVVIAQHKDCFKVTKFNMFQALKLSEMVRIMKITLP